MTIAKTKAEYLLELQKPTVLKNIPTVELSLMLLILCKVAGAGAACDAIVKELRGSSWNWVQDKELFHSALVILAVYTYRPAYIDGVCLAYLTNKMLISEAEVGGPYCDNSQRVDMLTNLAVSRLFTTLGSRLPRVDSFLKSHSLASADEVSNIVFQFLSDWPTPNFSKSSIAKLSAVMPYAAKALTYKKPIKSDIPSNPTAAKISARVYTEIQRVNEPLKSCMLDVWNMVNQADVRNEIKLLPAYFASSLQVHPKSLSRQLCINLGAANFFTWMAYTIYDDFFDDEGQTKLLPVANSSLRMALHLYSEMYAASSDFNQQILQNFNKMDVANSWEISKSRFEIKNKKVLVKQLPDYGNLMVLADRAIGHVLGPLVMLDTLSIPRAQQNNVEKGLRYFLIAKQLSDDLMDWRADFQKGHISAVVSHMLRAMKVAPGSYDISEMTRRIQKYFWSGGLQEINQIILKYLTKSRNSFKESLLLNFSGDFFLYIFDPLEESVRENELEYIHQRQFLATYSKELSDV